MQKFTRRSWGSRWDWKNSGEPVGDPFGGPAYGRRLAKFGIGQDQINQAVAAHQQKPGPINPAPAAQLPQSKAAEGAKTR